MESLSRRELPVIVDLFFIRGLTRAGSFEYVPHSHCANRCVNWRAACLSPRASGFLFVSSSIIALPLSLVCASSQDRPASSVAHWLRSPLVVGAFCWLWGRAAFSFDSGHSGAFFVRLLDYCCSFWNEAPAPKEVGRRVRLMAAKPLPGSFRGRRGESSARVRET